MKPKHPRTPARTTAAPKKHWVKFNINEYVRVKLTPRGREIHRAKYDDFHARIPHIQWNYRPPTEDRDGWSEWQAWQLMQTYGEHMGLEPPFSTEIEFQISKPIGIPPHAATGRGKGKT